MTFEEVKEMFKKSIDATDTMNQAIENLIQSIYLKGYNDASKSKWIPVSERLPKPYTWVYVTCHSLVNDWEDWVIDTIYEPQPKDSPYSDWGNIEMLNNGECEVIAWMEWISPEPYKPSTTGAGGVG